MNAEEALFVGLFLVGLFLVFIWMIDTAYVHFRYQKTIDWEVYLANGQPFGNFGIFVEAPRLCAYGCGLVFPAIARKRGFYEPIRRLPRNQRYHLIFLFASNLVGLLLMLMSGVIGEYFGLMDEY